MDTYIKYKIFTEFYIPAIVFGIVLLIILFIIIKAFFEDKKINKIKTYMKSNGYEYYLRNVSSFGGKAWWAYRKGDVRIDEDDLYKMSFREIKKRFK